MTTRKPHFSSGEDGGDEGDEEVFSSLSSSPKSLDITEVGHFELLKTGEYQLKHSYPIRDRWQTAGSEKSFCWIES